MSIDKSGAIYDLPLRRPPLERAALERQESDTIRSAFRTPGGKAALEVLREVFDHHAAYYADTGLMHYMEGQRSVVDYIEECIK